MCQIQEVLRTESQNDRIMTESHKSVIINCRGCDTNGASGYFCQWKTTMLITRRRSISSHLELQCLLGR